MADEGSVRIVKPSAEIRQKEFIIVRHNPSLRNTSKITRLALSLLTLTLWIPSSHAGQPDPGPGLGTNLTFLAANAGEWPFVDHFKSSTPWIVGPTPPAQAPCSTSGGTLNVDPNGWITSLASGEVAYTFQFVGSQGQYPSGDYTVLYDGIGTLEYEGSGSLVSQSPGQDIIHINASDPDGLCMTLTQTDPTDHLRNIRIVAPGGVCRNNYSQFCSSNADCGASTCRLFNDNGFYEKQIFHPTFLRNMSNYEVVRFSHWMFTNESPFVNWADYPQYQNARWNVAPARIMAELGNRLDADLWINIPHQANDRFIQELAEELLKYTNPTLKIYVEYSNETWNPAFQQFLEIADLGCQAFSQQYLAGCQADLNPNDPVLCQGHPFQLFNPSCEEARRRFHSSRSVRAWDIFVQRFGINRVVRVMASQSGNDSLHADLLQYANAGQDTDVLSTALYFGYPLGLNPDVANWDLPQLFDEIEHVEIPDALDLLDIDVDYLNGDPNLAHITYMNYEGGQHLVGIGALQFNQAMNSLFDNANREDLMGDRYEQFLNGWAQRDNDGIFMHYVNAMNFKDWGRFGALEYQDQDPNDAVKYTTLMNFFGYPIP